MKRILMIALAAFLALTAPAFADNNNGNNANNPPHTATGGGPHP